MRLIHILSALFSSVFLCASTAFCLSPQPHCLQGGNGRAAMPVAAGKADGTAEKLITVQREYTDYFSTIITVSLRVPEDRAAAAAEACAAAEAAIADIEKSVSISMSESDIYRFNNELAAGASMEITDDTYALIVLAKDLYEFTDGAYDPSVAQLVDLWGFSPRFYEDEYSAVAPYDREDYQNDLPKQEYIDAFQTLAAFDEVTVDEREGKYYLTKPQRTVTVEGVEYGVKLDFGGIAKGYACDVAAEIFREYGFVYGNVSVGNSSVYLLQNDADANGNFNIAVRNPRPEESGINGDIMATLQAKDGGLSTSGDYERYYVIHNKRYCHIISSETGEPIDTGICTACIVGGSAAENDALTTAICVMGKERAMEFMTEKITDKTAFFVWENRQTGKYEVIANCEKEEITLNAAASGFALCGYVQDGAFVYEPSAAFDWVQVGIAVVLAVAVLGVIVGLGYRNHVLKRNKTSKEE